MIIHTIFRMQSLSQDKNQERLGRRNLVIQEQQHRSNPIFVVNVLIEGGLMKAVIGAIIGIVGGIIGPINTILNHLIEKETVTINKVRIGQEIQAVAVVQIVVNVVGVVDQLRLEPNQVLFSV